MTVRLLKRQLRREIQQTLRKLTDQEVAEECISAFDKAECSESLCEEFIPTSPIHSKSKCFNLSFHALRGISNRLNSRKSISLRLYPIMLVLILGKRVFVPFIDGQIMKMVETASREDLKTFVPNSWGIPEPSSIESRAEGMTHLSKLNTSIR